MVSIRGFFFIKDYTVIHFFFNLFLYKLNKAANFKSTSKNWISFLCRGNVILLSATDSKKRLFGGGCVFVEEFRLWQYGTC